MRGGERAPDKCETNRNDAEDSVSPRILLVEHCEPVSRMISNVLRRHSYEVFPTATVDEALELHAKTNHIDLFIGEVVLPGRMSGYSLAQTISSRQSGLPIIFVTGHPIDVITQLRDYSASHTHLFKPFGIAELATMVSQKLRLRAHDRPIASSGRTTPE